MRVKGDRQLTDEAGPLREAIRSSYPGAYACAQRCRTVLELRLGRSVTQDEVVYLTLHVARLTTEGADRSGTS
ncbi:PRD domain-containing protein [uncultured Arsenicicoccus sp.]|uniref:PRD domain-containing protein n=1 Tax=uncultured Arsenicicoccus sp. TaxID=491339 RepID=UPI00338E97CA